MLFAFCLDLCFNLKFPFMHRIVGDGISPQDYPANLSQLKDHCTLHEPDWDYTFNGMKVNISAKLIDFGDSLCAGRTGVGLGRVTIRFNIKLKVCIFLK